MSKTKNNTNLKQDTAIEDSSKASIHSEYIMHILTPTNIGGYYFTQEDLLLLDEKLCCLNIAREQGYISQQGIAVEFIEFLQQFRKEV